MNNYFDNYNKNDLIKYIQDMYKSDDRPWIVGYSGGKDSSTVTQLIFESLEKLNNKGEKLHKPVNIIFADTLVENPLIIDFIGNILDNINSKANELDLPIRAQKVFPKYEESFWT
ncbi:MAG: DNA phosphorothioation system sulfurtransferase DndC, partial [bacterium]